MPDPSLQAYLASKYLSGPKADAILARSGAADKKKRKKRKHDEATAEASSSSSSSTGLRLLDDDDAQAGLRRTAEEEEQDALEAQVVEGPKAAKFKRIGLTKVKVDDEPEDEDDDPESQPQIAEGAELKAQHQRALEASRQQFLPSSTRPEPSAPPDDLQFQTVYRDKSGRKIDVRAEEEARKQAEAAKRKKDEERKTWGQGMKQKEDQKAARARLREEASTSFARHADDKRMNDTLRSIERSDDPALAFLTQKRSASNTGPPKPKYKGPTPAPNRFGIAPGYRWDGVDRSTGFEKMYFQKLNERKRRNASALAYDQDDL
ncbi:Pre-mRNA-splicing factor cwc26 [Tilletia horrida]|nr:Pre-mRNA-splicing factor cwc26 [Tilletia horrida]